MVAMRKAPPPASPDAYVAGLDGWRRDQVVRLRAGVRAAGSLDEVIKWGHLVYLGRGPVLLIRAEDERVLFGFWRGRLLRDIEPRIKPGGKYDMGTLDLREGDSVSTDTVTRLVRAAISLDAPLPDPRGGAGSSRRGTGDSPKR